MAEFCDVFGEAMANKPSLSDYMTPDSIAATLMILQDIVWHNGFQTIHLIDTGSSAVTHMQTAARHTMWVKHGFFLAADAVQTFLSTGEKPFAFQNIAPGIKIDLVAVCKKSSVGAVLFGPDFMAVPGNTVDIGGVLDSTLGGNIGSILRFAVVAHLVKHTPLLKHSAEMGTLLLQGLQTWKRWHEKSC